MPPADFGPLADYGWDRFFADAWAQLAAANAVPGRVVTELRGVLGVQTADAFEEAVIAGRLRHRAAADADLPAVGDWVALERPAGLGRGCRVVAVLPRRSKFSRQAAGARTAEQVVAANIDIVLLVCGLDGDFNLRRIERFLATARQSGADALIVLNKADQVEDAAAAITAVRELAGAQTPVLALSARHGHGVETLLPHVRAGRTLALVGSSGAGKSTLINRLAGADVLRTGEVRSRDDRGQHTTTHRELVRLPCGALLIDNPGIRELQLWQGDETPLADTFEDVLAAASACRFSDCRHQNEPDCGVRAAVESGQLDPTRVHAFERLEAESERQRRRQDGLAQLQEKRKLRTLHKAARDHEPRRIR